MPQQTENRTVPYLADQMFHLVADVQSYPQFLPWVLNSKIYNIDKNTFDAELTVGAGPMSQAYTSKVEVDPIARIITATYIKGPFKHLNNRWSFTPSGNIDAPTTDVEFFIDFEIDNLLLKPIVQPFLTQATSIMIEAFEKRAAEVFITNT